ncbi:MAG: PglZ domain-containing protein [Chloroflexota bacterium]|nr:PglZ domain-containing protein [Chloroflexota bacterium]
MTLNIVPDSLQAWLTQQINQILSRKKAEPPFIVWCDPDRVWKELLQIASADGSFELWADEGHELLLRERFYQTPRTPRVIWLPVARENLTYFKVFELQAAEVKTWGLPEALAHYGVEIAPDMMAELRPQLGAYAREWFNHPRAEWRELTPGTGDSKLVSEDLILTLLATPGKTFEQLESSGRFPIFARRVTSSFGLPAPKSDNPEGWRVQAVAALLCTDAAANCPDNPPGEQERIVPSGPARENALSLLKRWQRDTELLHHFEGLSRKADNQTALQYWAKNLAQIPAPLASPIAEKTLFQVETERLAAIDSFEDLTRRLEAGVSNYQTHAGGFWGQKATEKVRWNQLAEMAEIASLLSSQSGVEKNWYAPQDAIKWFTAKGWQVDGASESLFVEDSNIAGALLGVRHKLRKAYQRHLSQINTAFSELLTHNDLEEVGLPYTSNLVKELVEKASTKEPVAVLVLDACRYDLGNRLAELLNQGEPTKRAEVETARAPLPSMTGLGMPYCLPIDSHKLRVELPEKDKSSWRVTAEGFEGDLTILGQRKEWLMRTLKLKENALMSVEQLLESGDNLTTKQLGRLVFVFGTEFDLDGHEGQLKIKGSDHHIDRYAKVVRKLRTGGYTTVLVVTDHGFFHWNPESHEVEPKPAGEVYWTSRRAVVGLNLHHPSALKFKVSGSKLECRVPRSVNAFKTYGGLGFFHGGATLQELIIPVVVARWPKKATKIDVVLKPITHITSLSQRVEVAPASNSQYDLMGNLDEKLLGRQVLVKVLDEKGEKTLFKSKIVALEPGGETQILTLEKVAGAEAAMNSPVEIRVFDADNDDLLDQRKVTLRVELTDWDF